VDRRTFIKATGLPLGASALGLDTPAFAATQATPRSSVVVVGGGAFGAWTALTLREMGHSVTLLDAYGPGNSRATSGDETRQIRCGYGDRELYSRSALRAFTAWRTRYIDRHPAYDNVLIARGGSGHGFKHGPVLGEYIAKRALGEPTDPAFDHMVRLARS